MLIVKKLNNNGFAHLAILLVIISAVVIGLVGWRIMSAQQNKNTNTNTTSNNQQASNEPELRLSNLGMASMDNVLIDQNAVREYQSRGLKGFYVFGDKLGGKEDLRLNPNFEFASVKPGTKVISAIDGKVMFIKEQVGTGDMEVFIQPKENSAWTIGYDHLSNVSVKKGDDIKAGEVIGEPSVQGNGSYRFEIQVNKDLNGTTTHYCPSNLLADNVKSKLLGELETMQNAWMSTTGISDLYNLSAQNPVGCLKLTMTSSEAEGN